MAFKLFLGKKKQLVFFFSPQGEKKNKNRENRVSEWRQTIPGKKNTIPLVTGYSKIVMWKKINTAYNGSFDTFKTNRQPALAPAVVP